MWDGEPPDVSLMAGITNDHGTWRLMVRGKQGLNGSGEDFGIDEAAKSKVVLVIAAIDSQRDS
jgi:hypothetical protein